VTQFHDRPPCRAEAIGATWVIAGNRDSVNANGVIVRGLAIDNCNGNGIVIDNPLR